MPGEGSVCMEKAVSGESKAYLSQVSLDWWLYTPPKDSLRVHQCFSQPLVHTSSWGTELRKVTGEKGIWHDVTWTYWMCGIQTAWLYWIDLFPTGSTYCVVALTVLLCLSVIRIPFVIIVLYFKNPEKGTCMTCKWYSCTNGIGHKYYLCSIANTVTLV